MVQALLLKEWKIAVIAALAVMVMLLGWLWQEEVKAFAEFKGAIVVLGREAEKHAKEVNDRHATALKETKDEWAKQLPGLRSAAIDNYLRRFPRGLCGNSSGSQVPGNANNPSTSDGAVRERMAPEGTGNAEQDAFVAACAKDAAKLRSLRAWVGKSQLRVEAEAK